MRAIDYTMMRLRRESPIHIYVDLFHEDTMSSIDLNLKFTSIRKCNLVYNYLEMHLDHDISMYEIYTIYERIQSGR